jgi:hypothetical protein
LKLFIFETFHYAIFAFENVSFKVVRFETFSFLGNPALKLCHPTSCPGPLVLPPYWFAQAAGGPAKKAKAPEPEVVGTGPSIIELFGRAIVRASMGVREDERMCVPCPSLRPRPVNMTPEGLLRPLLATPLNPPMRPVNDPAPGSPTIWDGFLPGRGPPTVAPWNHTPQYHTIRNVIQLRACKIWLQEFVWGGF